MCSALANTVLSWWIAREKGPAARVYPDLDKNRRSLHHGVLSVFPRNRKRTYSRVHFSTVFFLPLNEIIHRTGIQYNTHIITVSFSFFFARAGQYNRRNSIFVACICFIKDFMEPCDCCILFSTRKKRRNDVANLFLPIRSFRNDIVYYFLKPELKYVYTHSWSYRYFE